MYTQLISCKKSDEQQVAKMHYKIIFQSKNMENVNKCIWTVTFDNYLNILYQMKYLSEDISFMSTSDRFHNVCLYSKRKTKKHSDDEILYAEISLCAQMVKKNGKDSS